MDRATRRAVKIRVVVVAVTVSVMLVISLMRSSGAEAAIDVDRTREAAVAAVMAGIEYEAVMPVVYSAVVDEAAAREYAAQIARLFMVGVVDPVTGQFEYASLPASAAAAFHRKLGIPPGDWAAKTTGEIVLMMWSVEPGTFSSTGYTLVVLLDLESGLETRAIVEYAQTSELRDSATKVTRGTLTVSRITR